MHNSVAVGPFGQMAIFDPHYEHSSARLASPFMYAPTNKAVLLKIRVPCPWRDVKLASATVKLFIQSESALLLSRHAYSKKIEISDIVMCLEF